LVIDFMGLLFFNPAWFCNWIFGVAAASLFLRRRFGPTWLPYVAGGVASAALFGPYLCAITGGPLGDGTGLDTGGKLWIVSVWLASISVILAPRNWLDEFQPTRPSGA
jgi:hypothetical protein